MTEQRSAETLETRSLLTPVLSLNPVAGLEGEITNFDGQFAGVTPGNQYTIDVNWGDGSAIQQISGIAVGGGLDEFTVSHNYANDGAYSISAKLTESPLIIGADAIFVIDVSGSTQTLLSGPSIGDVNLDGRPNTVLDLEIAGFMALNQDLIGRGLGNISKVSLVSFDATARSIDLNPAMAGIQSWTIPLADNDHNGVRDVDQALRTLRSLGGTNFEAALQTTINVTQQVGTQPGHGNIVFLSDGESQNVAFVDEAAVLRNILGMNVRAFGVGANASLNQLRMIDPVATTFTNTNQLLSTFSGSGTLGGGISTASIVGHITNVAPEIISASVTSAADNGGIATLSVTFSDPGLNDIHAVRIQWGDGASEEIAMPVSERTVSLTHNYAGATLAANVASIHLSVVDDTGAESMRLLETLVNVAPTVSILSLTPSVDENGFATLDGFLTDPGESSAEQVTIEWGDGSSQTLAIVPGAFQVFHQYMNDGSTPSPLETYSVTVLATDSFGLTNAAAGTTTVQNVAPVITALNVTPTVDENGVATLTGSFTDVGTLDTHTVSVAWGDGSVETIALAAGERAFSLTHQYRDDAPSGTTSDGYVISVSVSDDDTGTVASSVTTTVQNVAPVIAALDVTPTVDENGVATLAGSFTDVGTLDTHTVSVAWGDGSVETIALAAGERVFSRTHQYLDDAPSGTASDAYVIGVSVSDDDTATVTSSATTTVQNVAPVIAALDVTPTVDENGVATLVGSFTDVGALDTHTVSIAWGDGSVETIALAAGERAFSLTHQYLDDAPSGTARDAYVISVSVSDDDTGTVASSATTTVQNVAPMLLSLVSSATMQSIGQAGQAISISGQFSDVGRLDTYQVTVNWGDGSPDEVTPVSSANGIGVLQLTHIYHTGGIFQIGVTLADDDSGTVSGATSAIVSGVRLVDGVLQVIGTNQNDRIELDVEGEDDSHRDHQTDHNSGRSIEVKARFLTSNGNVGDDHNDDDHNDDHAGRRRFDLADVQSILIIGADGNDRIDVSEDIRLNTLIDGGTGNEDIHGGGGSDVILGGLGHDQLSGRDGRDILIGGDGRDELDGGDHDDILIGNQTTYDSTDLPQTAAWNAIQAEWTSGRSRNVRMQNLMDGSGSAIRLNDDFFIRLGSDPTIFDDGDRDLIDGDKKEDWMFLMGTDRRDS